jgi:hypothetical protein
MFLVVVLRVLVDTVVDFVVSVVLDDIVVVVDVDDDCVVFLSELVKVYE